MSDKDISEPDYGPYPGIETREQQTVMCNLKGEMPPEPMREVIANLKKYIDTWDRQPGIERWPDEMLIDDVIYGLGAAISKEYEYAQGFRKFKKRLIKHIGKMED